MESGKHLRCLALLRGRRIDNSTSLNHVKKQEKKHGSKDYPGGQHSRGKLVPHMVLWTGIASEDSKKDVMTRTWNVRILYKMVAL